MRRSTREVMPGFGLTLGVTISCLSAIVVAPAAALAGKAMAMPWGRFAEAVLDPRTLAAFRLTVLASLAAATVNMAFGFVVAWTFTRYSFPGKRIWDAMVDLPFALPTAVSGISLATVYSKTGWIGQMAHDRFRQAPVSPGDDVFVSIRDARVFHEDYTI